MTEVRRSADCGNSPKNRFAEDFVIALLTADQAKIEQATTPEFHSAGGHGEGALEILIDHVVTHGKAGAVNGTVKARDGGSRGFCFMLTFASAKADRVSSAIRYDL